MHPFAAAEIQFAAHEIRCRRPQFYTPLEYDSSATSNNGTAIYAAQFAVAYTGKINRKTSNTSINYQLDIHQRQKTSKQCVKCLRRAN